MGATRTALFPRTSVLSRSTRESLPWNLRGEALHLPKKQGLPGQLPGQKPGHLGPGGDPDLLGPLGQEEGEDASCGQDLEEEKGSRRRPQAKVNPAHPAMIP